MIDYKLHIDLPQGVKEVLEVLSSGGFCAYVVGGCIRDSILGKVPDDWDITTNALPQEVKRLFKRTVDTGIKHGTVTVFCKNDKYEITTFRSDGIYRDHRHPKEVSFSNLLSDDLSRRDFTINTLAYNECDGLIDYFDGLKDLVRGIIRAVGDPDKRFGEDALRILRAVRFGAQYDFVIEKNTASALKSHAKDLKFISKERIFTEISKLVCSAHIERLSDIFKYGLSRYIGLYFDHLDTGQLYEIRSVEEEKYKIGNNLFTDHLDTYYNYEKEIDIWNHELPDGIFGLSGEIPLKYRYIRFTYACEGMSPERAKAMLRSLKADNHTVSKVSKLLDLIFCTFPAESGSLKDFMSGTDPDIFRDALELKRRSSHTALYRERCKDEDLFKVLLLYEDIIKKRQPVYIRDLAVNGDDLIEAGFMDGPGIGEILRYLLNVVHLDPGKNEREILLEYALDFDENSSKSYTVNK